jgi:hypothetical protein
MGRWLRISTGLSSWKRVSHIRNEGVHVGIREKLNESPRLTTGITIGLIVLSVILIVWLNRSGGGGGMAVPRGYWYSDDDGATKFSDEMYKPTPFKHEATGKEAVRARVFKCGENSPEFIGYLEKMTPEGKRELEKLQAELQGRPSRNIMMLMTDEKKWLVKKPGQGKWIPKYRPEAQDIKTPKCPDGGAGEPVEVLPGVGS